MIGSHIIPKFYLEQFATPSLRGRDRPGRIWVYEKGKDPDERATSVQGKENGYFGYTLPDGTFEESFETVLAEHEDECNEVLVCSKFDTFTWPRGAQEKLAFYAALLYSRATQRRNFSDKQWQRILTELSEAIRDDQLIKEISDEISEKLKVTITQETLRSAINRYLQESATSAETKNSFLSGLLQNANLIANLLLSKKPWRIIRPSDNFEFITTDNPLVSFVPLGNGMLHPGYGFRKEIVAAVFPIASGACLLMGNAWRVPYNLTPDMTENLNKALISICDRYVYSKSCSTAINQVTQEDAGICRYGENAFLPVGLKIPRPGIF